MPHFSYKAVRADGTSVKAREFADTLNALESKLQKQQMILLEAQQVRVKSASKKLINQFIAQFAPLIESGISIDRALRIIAEGDAESETTALATLLYDEIKQGSSLSDAMVTSGSFDTFAYALVKAGEASGQLAEVLKSLEEHYAARAKLRSDIISALSYPAILMVVSVLSLVLISFYLVPVFQDLFSDRIQMLPAHTRAVFVASDFLRSYSLPLFGGIFLAVAGIAMLHKRSENMRRKVDSALMQLPLSGRYLNTMNAANILNIWGVLLANGVSLLQALELSINVPTTIPTREGVRDCMNQVRRGVPLSEAVTMIPHFPSMPQRFIAVGEETGTLDQMTAKAGDQLSQQVQTGLRRFSTLLGPVVILIMGGLIGFIVISMLSAVYSFSELI